MINGREIIDIGTAAAKMGITTEALRKRVTRGALPATKKNGRWYFVLDSIDGVLDDERDVQDMKQGILDNHRDMEQGVLDDERDVQDMEESVQDNHLDNKDRLINTLAEELAARRKELDELRADHRREIQELHVLLQTAQTALTAPERRPWWRLWG